MAVGRFTPGLHTFDFCRRDTPLQFYRYTRLIDVFRENHRDLFRAPSEDVGDLLVGKPGRLAVCRTRAAEIVEVALDLARQLRIMNRLPNPGAVTASTDYSIRLCPPAASVSQASARP